MNIWVIAVATHARTIFLGHTQHYTKCRLVSHATLVRLRAQVYNVDTRAEIDSGRHFRPRHAYCLNVEQTQQRPYLFCGTLKYIFTNDRLRDRYSTDTIELNDTNRNSNNNNDNNNNV